MACSDSPMIATSGASVASVSSVTFTEPSREFSMGTRPRCTSPSRTATMVSKTPPNGTGSQRASTAAISTSCV